MAIEFNPKALSAFASVNFGEADAIVNLDGKDGFVQNGNRGRGIFAKIRSLDTRANNNAVRTEFLKALGNAFGLDGISENREKTTFSSDFIDKLADLIGPAFKRDDFGIAADGTVASGRPLTQRRITAIFRAACAKADTVYDATTYRAKAAAITDWLETRDQYALSTISGRGYCAAVGNTIAFLEDGIKGFSESCSEYNLEQICSFVFKKTSMNINPEGIKRALNIEDAVVFGKGQLDQIKDYIKGRLETMVKTTVDILLEAKEKGEFPRAINIIWKNYNMVEKILNELYAFKKANLG